METGHIPSAIQQYQILRRLGAGGMGEVFLATDTRLRRQVAIKFLLREGLHNSARTERVLREARAAAALDHPNICPVFAVGEHGDQPFIVMQYVEGETLASRLRGGRLDPASVLEIGAQMAEALHAAHSRGIVHRDVKPQNIIVTASGQAKLLDFGVAKVTPVLLPGDETGPAPERDSLGGGVVGTPAYMAPEQARGQPVDGRADLFALGAVLYECFTGRPAFLGPSLAHTLEDVLRTDPPAPSAVVPGLRREHDQLCQRLLAKDPASRFNTAQDVATAIREAAEALGHAKSRSLVPRRAIAVSALSFVVLAIALTGWQLRGPGSRAGDGVPETARRWYDQGAEAVREGAYTTARRALMQALAQHDRFPLAHARLAEALSELDESGPAKNALLRVHELVPDPGALALPDRLRLVAIGATVVRNYSEAVKAYAELAARLPGQSDVLVDLGRALERSEKRDDALAAYRRATTVNPDSAVGHLRLAVLLGDRGSESDALEEFDKARAIYDAASSTEGVVETLLARGTWLNGRDRLVGAKRDLELALRLSTDTGLDHQRVRSMLQLSTVIASEGRFKTAEAMVTDAVDLARRADMDGLAASSLIDFGNVLLAKGRGGEATRSFAQADEIARRRGARRIAARAALSMGSALVSSGRPRDAIPFIERGLAFYRDNGYVQNERIAMTLLASAYAGTGELERSRRASEQLLTTLRAAGDEAGIALASERLSGVLLDMGRLPEALAAIRASLEINQRTGNQLAIPFNLTREADVLARLGRSGEAAGKLATVQDALDSGQEAYVARAASINLIAARLRSLTHDWPHTLSAASTARSLANPEQESIRLMAQITSALARANLRGHRDAMLEARSALSAAEQTGDARLLLNIREWVVLVFDSAGDAGAAHAAAETALAGLEAIPNQEAAWRVQAIAALSASALKLADADGHRAAAAKHWEALTKAWGPEAFATYSNRPDVKLLRKRIRL